MRMSSKVLGSVLAVGVALVAFSTTSSSKAGDEELVNVSCSGGALTATAKAPWHTNDKAPWKWDKGNKVSIDEHAAKFTGAACEGSIKAFICNGGECKGPIPVAVH